MFADSVMTAWRSCSVPTPLPVYLPPSNAPPWFLLPKTSSKYRKTEIITQEHVTTLPSLIPTNTYSLTLRYPPGIDLPTYFPPHSQYIQPPSRVPSARSPHIHPLPTHNTYNLFLVTQVPDLPTYILSLLTIHTASFSCPNRR